MKDSKKSIVLASNYAWTVFNFRLGLIRALKREGYLVTVVAQFDGWEKALQNEVDRCIPLYISRSGTNPFIEFVTFLHFFYLLGRLRPDVFIPLTVKPVLYGGIAARLLSVNVVTMITGLGTAFLSGAKFVGVVKLLYKISLAKVGIVFFQNKADLSLFVAERLVTKRQAKLIPGSGIDLAHFAHQGYRMGEESSIPIFLFVGRLLGDKGIREYAAAAKSFLESGFRARFQIIGPLGVQNKSAISRLELEDWVNDGIVEYLGEQSDVRPYIAAATCVVLPSYREGTSRVLLETLSIGRIAITTDVPGCADVVDDCVTGFVCQARNVGELTNAMIRVIETPFCELREMGLKARRKAESVYDEQIVFDAFYSAIEEVAREK